MDEATAALFPDSFEESELGLVPKGWKVGTLADCCLRVESGGTPKRTTPEYWNGNVSWLTSGEVRNPIVFDTKEKITELGVKESSAKIWPEGTTIVAMYGATAGEVCLLAKPTTANQACCGLIPRKDFKAFLFFCVRRERENLASKSSGSAQQNLNKALVSGHQILMPSDMAVTAYENVVGVLLAGWIGNEQKAQTFATLRDTLLPRLISGQLRVPEVEGVAL
jgi:type I restriction enzyme S subunit